MNEILGWYSSFIYSLYLIPQIIKTYTTKSVEDLSVVTLWITFSGGFGMFLYLFPKKGLYPVKFNNYSGLLVVEAEQDPKKANPFQYAKIGYKYLTETLNKSDIKVSQS